MDETQVATEPETLAPAPEEPKHPENPQEPVSGSATAADITGGVRKRKKKKNESSVVYISRIPPGMDIGALRSRLSRMGALGRVWLRPEDGESVATRRALGGRRRTGFQDGWVEFTRRRDAKNAVVLLNGQPMSGARRGGRWGSDLWCLRLLPRDYVWQTLIEETGATARQHVLRVKAAVAAGRRERHLIEEREALARRIARRDGEAERSDGESAEEPESGDQREKKRKKAPTKRVVRRFKQREAVRDAAHEEDVDERRARELARKAENGEPNATAAPVDSDLVRLLFDRKNRD